MKNPQLIKFSEHTGLSFSELGKIGAYKRKLEKAKQVPAPEPRWPKCSCGAFLAMGCCPNCS
jgi:hypothetical protein